MSMMAMVEALETLARVVHDMEDPDQRREAVKAFAGLVTALEADPELAKATAFTWTTFTEEEE